jgi:hypothetical protein
MSGFFMGSTIANPNQFDSVEKLREALTAANQQLIQRDFQIMTLQEQLQCSGKTIAAICEQVLADDMKGLTVTLARLSAAYHEQQKKLQKRGMH